MRKSIFFGIILVLFPIATYAQIASWETMERPYFVKDAIGVAIGRQGGMQYTYMMASDLSNRWAYATNINGAESWPTGRRQVIDGVMRVSASSDNGLNAAAIVPWDNGNNPEFGVRFTTNGGQIWSYNQNSQPQIHNLQCVATHPSDPNNTLVGGAMAPPGFPQEFTCWRTTNGGNYWATSMPNVSTEATNSLRFLAIPESVELWACRDYSGIYKSTDEGGSWTGFSGPYQDVYDALDIARTKGIEDKHYYLLTRRNGLLKLWHSTSAESWTEIQFQIFEGSFEILATSANDNVNVPDTLWIASPDHLTMLSLTNNVINQQIDFPAGDNLYNWVDYTPAVYPVSPYPSLYLARRWSMERLAYNTSYASWINLYRVKGTNAANIANLSESISPTSAQEGLYALGEQAGYVMINKKLRDPNWPNDWELKSALLKNPIISSATGIDISAYYDGNDVKYIAIGTGIDANGLAHRFALNDGRVVPFEIDHLFHPPASLAACAGKKDANSPLNSSQYAAGAFTSDPFSFNEIVKIDGIDPSEFFFDSYPTFKDIILLKDSNHNGFFPFCVGGGYGTQDRSIYVRNQSDNIRLNNGLTFVNWLYAVAESGEKASQGISVLYAGSDFVVNGYGGVFKNNFNLENVTPWYRVSNGISDNANIISITTTKHLVDSGEQLDPIVAYALGDNGTNKYAYVTADSGRSWIEFGQYLRDNHLNVDRLEMIKDQGTGQSYVAVAGDDGLYRFPYNVKSGILTGTETWGPGLVIVNGDITVPYGMTLNISAGTEVLFNYNFDRMQSGANINKSELIVYGTLNINGVDGNPVTLKSSKHSNPGAGDWYGIKVTDNSSLNMRYCIVQHALNGVYGSLASSQGTPTNIKIAHCRFLNIATAGVDIDRPSLQEMRIDSSYFQDCSSYAIRIRQDDLATIPACKIIADTSLNCLNGIWYVGNSNVGYTKRPSIAHNVLRYTYSKPSGYGIYVKSYSTQLAANMIQADSIVGFYTGIYLSNVNSNCYLYQNKVKANSNYGLYLAGASPTISNLEGIPNVFNSSGIGIYCDRYSSPVVRSTKIKENYQYGVLIERTSTPTSLPDFGNPLSPGGNSIQSIGGLTYADMCYTGPSGLVRAVGNWWGENPPNQTQILGNIDYSGYLTSDPLPFYEKREIERLNMPHNIELSQNYPNPFNPATEISFSLPKDGFTSVNIYNIGGQLVKALISENLPAGEHKIIWDGSNSNGSDVASGVYFYILSTDYSKISKSMTLLR